MGIVHWAKEVPSILITLTFVLGLVLTLSLFRLFLRVFIVKRRLNFNPDSRSNCMHSSADYLPRYWHRIFWFFLWPWLMQTKMISIASFRIQSRLRAKDWRGGPSLAAGHVKISATPTDSSDSTWRTVWRRRGDLDRGKIQVSLPGWMQPPTY